MKLEAKGLVKSFGEKQVLREVSLSIASGGALGLLGRNGAGKTTAIRIIMGIFPADSGQVLLDGSPIRRRDLRIGYMPEERGLYPRQVIVEQLCYLGELQGMKRPMVKRRAAKKGSDPAHRGREVAVLLQPPDALCRGVLRRDRHS
jgi:ABC-2 type transport system ATP-binding protein